MKIAILQFNPRIGAVAANFSRAEALLMREERENLLQSIDLLVLPELAFTGYNHPSLTAISPYLEPTADGPSTRWAIRTAKRLKCTVAVGYPEASNDSGNYNTAFDSQIVFTSETKTYNSLVFVNASGEVIAHHRKAHLYYTDETWACEGQKGFYAGILPIGEQERRVKCAAGICMDINPYRFEAPCSAYEFAMHARQTRAKIVVVSCAWLTRLSAVEIEAETEKPDLDTINYWITRIFPLYGPKGADEEVFVVFANRIGDEGVDERMGMDVRYAGSSCVMGIKAAVDSVAEIKLWDCMGRGQDGILIVNTDKQPKWTIRLNTTAQQRDSIA